MLTGTTVQASDISLATEAPTAPFAFRLPAAHHSNIKAAHTAGNRQALLRCLTVAWDMAAHAVQVGAMLVLHGRTALRLLTLLGLSHHRGFGSHATSRIAKCQ